MGKKFANSNRYEIMAAFYLALGHKGFEEEMKLIEIMTIIKGARMNRRQNLYMGQEQCHDRKLSTLITFL